MSLIVRRGDLPPTPHTEFYAIPDVLALEEIHGSYGFSGPWSRKLHVRHYPTELVQKPTLAHFNFTPTRSTQPQAFQPYLLHTDAAPVVSDALRARKALLHGPNTVISLIKSSKSFANDEFFRNAERHEIYFIQRGSGVLSSEFGRLTLRKNAYVIVPKGTTYRIDVHESIWAILVESSFPIEWPPHYMNHAGQAHLVSPVVETEIEAPEYSTPVDQSGKFTVFVQHKGGAVTETLLAHHPFDVCGWEGSLYPYVFDILKHHGIARAIHTAPPAHQTFQSGNVPNNGFSLCSFVPQVEGWDPKDVGAPYAHLNVDSDELMFFCNSEYGARKGVIREGSLTFHPGGVPHSPHGEAAKRSLTGRGKMLDRLAVMLDTYFENLEITQDGLQLSDPEYAESWFKARVR